MCLELKEHLLQKHTSILLYSILRLISTANQKVALSVISPSQILSQNTILPQFAEEASALSIPQFFLKSMPDLFGGKYELLELEDLKEQAIPRYMQVSKEEREYAQERLAKLPPEKKGWETDAN